jgi:aminoglycoside phosphotransferase family enzyme
MLKISKRVGRTIFLGYRLEFMQHFFFSDKEKYHCFLVMDLSFLRLTTEN